MRYFIRQKIKAFCAFLIILILLPYTISVFVNGADVRTENGSDSPYVSVRTSEEGTVVDISWKEYLAGILAREMSEDYEMDALKAQAVLIRTKLYRDLENSEDKILTEKYMTREEMEKKWKVSEYKEYHDKYIRAVEETDDTVLFYNGTYAWTPYHQSSCGYTRSAEEVMGTGDYPYISCRECPLDKKADDEILYSYFNSISKGTQIETIFHERLLEEYGRYLIVGGMPECVSSWIENHDFDEVSCTRG